jgi:lipoyl(octanoyl) transferase
VTSLELESAQEPAPTLEQASNAVARQFGRVFGRQVIMAESLDRLLQQKADAVL